MRWSALVGALNALVLAVIVPLVVSVIAYYGFCSNYTQDAFHEAGFRKQYEEGIYRYRLLGRWATLAVHDFISERGELAKAIHGCLPPPPAGLLVLDRQPSGWFYEAYFLTNTLFHILSAVALYMVLVQAGLRDTPHFAAAHLVGVLLIGLTQYVVCPYDNLSYFLVLLCCFLTMRRVLYDVPLVLVLVLATLTREAAVVGLSFYFAYYFPQLRAFRPRHVITLSVLLAAFVATYVLLRVYLASGQTFFQDVQLGLNYKDLMNLAGLIAVPAFAYAFSAGTRNVGRVWLFVLAASPYLVMSLVVGIAWETRLWVPFWLPLLVLARVGNFDETKAASEPEGAPARG